ncbi:MAG TPA: hypothetical protein VMG74_04560 [Gaiellaceae bacterium]|nr:hypothetical protein [Gaiellaceae bacterium]
MAILFRRFLGVGLVLFGAAYVVVDVTGGGASAASTLPYAVGLIVMAELILFAAELPRGGRADGSLLTSSLLVLAAVAVAAALLGLVVLAATTVRLSAGFEATLAGGASALALLALPLLLGRRNVPDGAAGYY